MGGAGTPAKKISGSGGFLGSLKHAGHWVGAKADLAAHDIEAMPAGFAATGEGIGKDIAAATHGNYSFKNTRRIGKGMLESSLESLEHPLRDPFQTLLTVGAVAAPVAGTAARLGAAAKAASAADEAGVLGRVADVGKALATKPRMPERFLNVPKIVGKDENAVIAHTPVQLQAAQAPLARAGQALHDKVIQRSLDRNVSAAHPTPLARYANRRVGKSFNEAARIGQRVRTVPVEMLERAGRHFDKGVPKSVGQLAMFLRSANVTGDEAAAFWKEQAAAGEDTGKLAKAAQRVHDLGLLRIGDDGRIAINDEKYPALGKADALLRENQGTREGIIKRGKLMSPEGLQTRKNLVAETMHSEAARNPTTGVREGQGYTPLRTSEKRGFQTPIARGRQPVIPQAKPFSVGKEATGAGVREGKVPDNTTAGVANATREALRYMGTVEHRGMVARVGSDIKRTGDDVLVADPKAAKLGKLAASDEQLLGRQRSTVNTISEEEHAGLAKAMKEKLIDAIPGLGDNFAANKEAELGTTAPLGYKWVPRQMLGDLTRSSTARGSVEKAMNDVNSAVTAMTVYFKLSHIPQRGLTNATTSAVSGALFSPKSLHAAITMRKALGDEDFAKASAATGTHGYLALPHEGTSAIAKRASRGASFYAHRIDAPFRFLNLVHEARKAGIDTPDDFRQLVAHASNPAKLTPKEREVLGRANRVSMMYDGLGENEQRRLARVLWFYPWTKAATRYVGHTIAEHPLKAAVGGQLGRQGVQVQGQRLGPLPSFEYGLLPLGGGRTSEPGSLLPFTTTANVAGLIARPGTTLQQANPAYSALLTALAGVNQFGEHTNSPIGDAASELFSPTPEAQILSSYRHPTKPTQIFTNTPLSELARSLGGPSVPRKTNKAALNKSAAKQHERSITIYLPH